MYNNSKWMNQTKNYKPCRIIYYNSGRYTFFETHLDKNTILFGNNNAGKTSFLNGLQFFLLPEINMHRLHQKFHVNPKYTKHETYEYYFPSANSFIVAEFENAFGRFVQILFRGKGEYAYSRIFTKASYDDIRNQLWDNETNEIRKVQSIDFKNYLKTTPNYRFVEDRDTIIDLIYSNDITNENNGRYAIVPIKAGNAKCENIRNLIKLAFNIDTLTDDDLKEILIRYVEGNLKNENDIIDVDFHKLCDKQAEYKSELDYNIMISNHIPAFNRCELNVQTLKALGPKLGNDYADFYTLNNRLVKQFAVDIDKINQECQLLEQAYDASKNTWNEAKNEFNKYQNQIDLLKTQLSDKETKFKAYTDTVAKFQLQDKSKVEQMLYFETIINQINDDLAIIDDKNRITSDINRLNKKILDCNKSILSLKATIETNSDVRIVYNQVGEEEKKLLRSIWAAESESEYILSAREKEIISSLSELIQYNEPSGYYILFNRKLHKSVDDLDIEIQKEDLAAKEKELIDLNEQIEAKRLLLDGEIGKNKEKLTLDIAKARESLRIISSYASYEEEISNLRDQIVSYTALKDEAAEKRDSTGATATQNNSVYVSKKSVLDQLKKEESEHKDFYQTIKMSADRLGMRFDVEDVNDRKINITKLTKDIVDNFSKELAESDKAKKALLKDLLLFVSKGIIEDIDNQLVSTDVTGKVMIGFVTDQLAYIYDNLEEKRKSIETSMLAGFTEAHRAAEIIQEYRKHVLDCVNDFNKKLESTNVSNFKCISLKVNFSMRFDDFHTTYKDIDNHNTTEESISRFFLKLRQFLDKTGIKDKITLDQILDNFVVQYHTEDGIETKAQSNGTNIMANSVLLSQLKSELVKGDRANLIFNYYLPIIIDEVSNIDNNNLSTLKKFLSEKELVMFCATPTPTISVDNNYEIIIYLSSNVRHEIFDAQRPVVHFLPENLYVRKIDSQEEDFGELKEA